MQAKSLITLGAVAALAAVSLAGCGNSSNSASQAKDQTLNWMESSTLPTMDNSLATDVVSGETLNNTGEGLLKFGKKQ